ncbi:hypothetical protein DLAC_09927 [Tieghemostelium lacteum]|uniref:BRO1 domain-containing protein n=1 Tax=Tieghemostelium lacteum TaxID=361077 RepID=A0A151Z5Q1_TIELA|nr:hypothetical protein DLAC_09927 [Tieghemostelium lacteum]|eukprot:KYQ89268.1 hypothetical protein DLAC_09927 [Tieghemostelium lacteum]
MNELEKPCKIYIHKLELPASKRIQFEKIIRAQTPQSTNDLALTSQARNEMIIVIEKSSAESSIVACEKYLTYLYGLILSVEDNSSLRLNEQLTFSWSSAFNKNSFHTGYSLRFELVMTLVTFGICHYNRVCEINNETSEVNFDDNAKLMVNHLKIASGIFEFISQVEISKWMNPPEDRPIECFSNFSIALSSLCMSLANLVSVLKAMKQGTSHLVVSKVACEAWHKAELSKNQFKDLPGGHFKKLSKSFRAYIATYISILYSITMVELSKNSKDEQKYSDALGYMSLMIPYSKLKKSSDQILQSALDVIMNNLTHEFNSLNKENELIYFTKKTEEKALVKPQAKAFLTSTVYSPPLPAFTSFS